MPAARASARHESWSGHLRPRAVWIAWCSASSALRRAAPRAATRSLSVSAAWAARPHRTTAASASPRRSASTASLASTAYAEAIDAYGSDFLSQSGTTPYLKGRKTRPLYKGPFSRRVAPTTDQAASAARTGGSPARFTDNRPPADPGRNQPTRTDPQDDPAENLCPVRPSGGAWGELCTSRPALRERISAYADAVDALRRCFARDARRCQSRRGFPPSCPDTCPRPHLLWA